MDPLIKHLQIQTVPYFGARGESTPQVQYSYYIGAHGPFQDSFAEGKDTVDAVKAAMQARIDKLRELGAVE